MTKGHNRVKERIEHDEIVIDGSGRFPRKLRIVEAPGRVKKYNLSKTSKGGYLLNK